MSGIEPKHLRVVERWTLVLGAVATGASLLALPRTVAFACAVGAAVMCGNATAIRWLSERAWTSRGGATPALGILLFNVKMALLIATVSIALFVFHLDGIGFLLGISIFPVAVVGAALSIRLEPDATPLLPPQSTLPNMPNSSPPLSGDR